MGTPRWVQTREAFTINDGYPPLLPVALATVGLLSIAVTKGNIVIGAVLLSVALIGCLRLMTVVDRQHGHLIIRRQLLGLSTSRQYDLKLVRDVEIRWSKFGNVLILHLVEYRKKRTLRVAGPTHTDLNPLLTSLREYLHTRTGVP